MTKRTYNLLIKYDKEYLIEFLRSVEKLPHVKYLGCDDLTLDEIKQWDNFYHRWFSN